MAGAIAAVLLAVNAMVLHNEYLIRTGQPLFVPLQAQLSPLPAQQISCRSIFSAASNALAACHRAGLWWCS
ncbi:hypothetical protein [Tahibacter aquaticus]|uniref:hypothetical protein n=1 Tax=Tahibacter aquaticus TaxID=520092 RepID=UPI00105CCF42|nr:hypothetical protein [Tahibacter aquaticus]